MMADCAHLVKSTSYRAFNVFSLPCRYVTDILQMCMKKLYAKTIYEKN